MRAYRLAMLLATVALAVAVLIGMSSEDATAQGGAPCQAVNEQQLASCIQSYNNDTAPRAWDIYLQDDVTLSGPLPAIDRSETVTLHGEGHTIAGVAGQDAVAVAGGNVVIRDVTITGARGAVLHLSSGGIEISGSTFSNNQEGVYTLVGGPVAIVNSTFFDNTFGIASFDSGAMTVELSTLVGNGQSISVRSTTTGAVTLSDSLVAGGPCGFAPGASSLLIDGGGNAFKDATCGGSATAGLAGSYANSLDTNGCTTPCTETIALRPWSPAVDAAGDCARVVDQRGELRTAGSCDSGAYELDCSNIPSTVGNEEQLAVAIGCYNQSLGGTTSIELTQDIVLSELLPKVDNTATLVIDGKGHTIDGNDAVTTVLFHAAGALDLVGVTITGATIDGFASTGGTASVYESTITGNRTGIAAASAEGTTVFNSTIAANTRWGIYVSQSVTVVQSTIVANQSEGIRNDGSQAAVSGSLIAANNGGVGDCIGTSDGGRNIFGDATCSGTATPGVTGTFAAALAGNGCTAPCTQTIALLAGSPAIDAAGTCDINADQRGVARTFGKCDAGAFEFGDIARCGGKLVTINLNTNGGDGTGTAGDDVILGTPGPDVIDGGAGSDTICGEGGDDQINGGVGDFRDFLYGGPGADTIRGGFGVDYIYGEDGDDALDGEGGSDRLYGGAGNDLMLGDSGADRMFGGPGDDEMFGMGGQDQMWGDAGNDVMQGNFQSDNMFGGPGNDTMFGAGGKDTLFGEGGNDTLAGGDNTDYLNGGQGVDSANGGRGRDKPLTEPKVSPGNGRFRDGAGCIAETIVNCQPTP